MARLKLLHICATPKAGGAETFFLRTMCELNKVADLHVVVREKSWLSAQLTQHNIPHHTLRFNRRFDFSTKTKLKQLIYQIQPDVVQAWMKRAAMFLPKIPVSTIGRLGGYYALKYFKNCDWLVGNTQDICTFIKEKDWPEDKIKYLPNFAPEPQQVSQKDVDDLRNEIKVPENAFVLFMSGRLHEVKGVDLAIKTVANTQNTFLILAGTGPEQENLAELAQNLGVQNRVYFAGWVNELAPYAALANAWLVPSRHEPLGNTLLDAWWHQTPAIVSKTAGPLSLAQEGETALFVETGSAESLTTAVQRLQGDEALAQKLAQNSFEYVKKTFSAQVLIPQYLQFYEEVKSCAA